MKDKPTVLVNDHGVFTIDHKIKTISVPQSVEEGDYPEEVKEYFNKRNYYKQLNIL